MSAVEIILVGLAVGGSAAYLARRGWRRWRGSRGCCGGCPSVRPKIRLAAAKDPDSICRP